MLSLPVYGQYCLDDSQCRSQLLRVEVAANAMGPGNVQQLMPALRSLSQSGLLQNALKRGFDLQPLSFPHSVETCAREKAEGDANFQNIDCNSKTLCSQANLKPVVREQICFKLPCPILEGTLQVGACANVEDIYPTTISFPGQLEIQNIKLTPTSVNVVGPRARLCFRVDELQLHMSAQLALDTANTQLPDSSIQIGNINPRLDQPHEACVSARVDLTSANPVSDIQVENPAGPFISDQMVREASQALRVTGLSGYPAQALQSIQAEVVPALFQPLRASIEDGIQKSLAATFQNELEKVIRPLTAATAGQSLFVNGQGFMSELGLANLEVHNQMARVECAALRGARRPIPPAHACIGLPEFGDETITTDFDSPVINELMNLQWKMQGKNITSESLKQRLVALKDVLRQQVDEFPPQPNDSPSVVAMHLEGHQAMIQNYLSEYVDPMLAQIETAQLQGQLYNFIEIQNQLQQGQSTNVGMSLPEICSATNPSPHAGRDIPNCPIQAYVDLNEFNKVLARMWETGAICQTGRGKFVPRLNSAGQPMQTAEGKPLGTGCYMEMSGMGCYLKSPPQIRFDTATRKYEVPLQLEKCFYPGVQLLFMNTGLGRFGADFNIDFAFRPKACHNGDFCMENPDVNWAVVPGSGSQGLGDDSWLQSIITGEIGKALNGALGNTIRIPLASGAGALANVPLQAEGRVDSGPGFFGACLEVQEEGTP
jgi:hypothetical protein